MQGCGPPKPLFAADVQSCRWAKSGSPGFANLFLKQMPISAHTAGMFSDMLNGKSNVGRNDIIFRLCPPKVTPIDQRITR